MFEHISTYHYGRCVKNLHNWHVVKSIGINRLHYIHSGSVSVLLNDTLYELKPGRFYLFPQNLKFELILNQDTCVDHTFLDFFTLPAIKMDSPLELNPTAHPLINSGANILLELASQFSTYPSMERNEYTDLVESYLNNLLFLINKTVPIGTITDRRINTVLDYIHRNFSNDITLEQLTALTGLETNYFIRLFKQHLNATPYQYIKKYRFTVAYSLIKRQQSLTQTAVQIGYADIASFSHAFKKFYGVSPSEVAESIEKQIAP